MPGLLDPLTPDQQHLIDLVADAFIVDEGKWPYFDYLEARFDHEHKDAWEVLYSLPRVGQWNYGAAWWIGINQPTLRPSPEQEIELTLVGMHHSDQMRRYVDVYLHVLRAMVEIRRHGPAARRAARSVSLTSEDLRWVEGRVPLTGFTLQLVPTLLKREPATWASGVTIEPDRKWAAVVPRTVFDYENVETIQQYVDRLIAHTTSPPALAAEAVSSPLGLPAALDYLDMAWRVVHSAPLFSYPSAERAAKLTYGANSAEEFDSRLTALGEILRTANTVARSAAAPKKLTKVTHDEPLAPLRAFVGAAASDRTPVDGAVDVLEAALSIRDAAQHTEAGGRAVRALSLLGIEHPVRNYAIAWERVSMRVTAALNGLREAMIADANL